MTKAENEMRILLKDCECLKDISFCDQTVVGKLNDNVVVKISFNAGTSADNRYGLFVQIINKLLGRIDAETFDFSSIVGKALYKGEPTSYSYHLYKNRDGEFDWYTDRPTEEQREEIMKKVYNYIEMFK